jgi:CHAT domain-containing protein/Tfp pilus assembly protein PilF
MRLHKFVLIIFSALLLSVSQPWWFSFSPVFGKSAVVVQTRDERKAEADSLLKQGIQQFQTGQVETALQSWQQALIIFREIKDRKGEGGVLTNLGVTYHALGDYTKAIEYHQQSLAIAREIKDRKGEGTALGNLGIAYKNLGDYLKAIEYHQQRLAIAQEIKDRLGEGKALGNLGFAYHSLGNYPKAIEYHQQSLAIQREIKDRLGEGTSLGGLANVYKDLGEYPKAIDYHQKSLAIEREIKYRLGEGRSLGGIGNVYDSLGDYPKAIDYQQQWLVIAREIKARRDEGTALGNLGITYKNLGNYPKAIEYHQQSLEIAREIKDRKGESNSLGNLGVAYNSLEDYPKAIEYYQKSLAIQREIKDRKGEGAVLGNLGIAYDNLEDYPKAIKYHQKSLAIQREIKDRLGEGNSLNNLGLASYKQGNLTLAESNLIEGIKVYESLRGRELKDSDKVSVFETQRNTYRTLQQVLIAENKTDLALEIAERGRGRAFVELLMSRLSANPEEQFPTLPNIVEIKQTAESQNTTFVQYSIIYDEFKVAGKRQVKESEFYIWVIKPTGEINFAKVDLKPLWQNENTSLEELVENIRDSIGVSDRNIFTRTNSTTHNTTTKRDQFAIKVFPSPEDDPSKDLQKLHSILIEPIADLLPTNPDDRVIFVPQDELFLVPFPALLDQKGKYLIEKHTILTAPSIQVLELTRQQKQKNQLSPASDTLIVGNPTMPSVSPKIGDEPQKLADLPGAKLEADAITKLLGTKALTGDAANETAVLSRIPQAKIIHLATHGILNNFQALKSAIALAPSGKDDGLLTAEEILNFKQKLKADLVVLSACDTGRGRITGDGVIGLSRSLFIAGTPSVIVSLWAVPDAPTAELMTEFYKNLYKNKNRLDKAQALRMAMLKMKDKYSDSPRKWAAFTLIGESK